MKILNLFKKEQQSKYVDVPVILENGITRTFPAGFKTDENSVVEIHSVFHRHLDCPKVQDAVKRGYDVKAMSRSDAESQGMTYCYTCEQYDKEDE